MGVNNYLSPKRGLRFYPLLWHNLLAHLHSFFYSVKKVAGLSMTFKRTPKNYDGNEPTGKRIGDILPGILTDLSGKFKDQPHLILEAWPEIVGEKVSKLSRAVSFNEGVLEVRVRNSSLLSLLVEHEKNRLLTQLKKRFPKVKIQDIFFKIGN